MNFDALDEVLAPEPKPSKTAPSEGSDGFELKSAPAAAAAADVPITKTDESRRRRRDLTEKLIEENIKSAEEDGTLEQGTEEQQFPDAEGVSLTGICMLELCFVRQNVERERHRRQV